LSFGFNLFFFLLIDVAIARLNDEKEKVGLMKMDDLKENCDNKKNWMSSAQLWTNQTKSVILIFYKLVNSPFFNCDFVLIEVRFEINFLFCRRMKVMMIGFC